MRNYPAGDISRQRFAEFPFTETLLDVFQAFVTIAGIELTGYDGLSCLHFDGSLAIITALFIVEDIVSTTGTNAMTSEKNSTIAIVMGSDSDLPVMQACIEQLKFFGIAPAVRIISAHRTPQIAADFAADASANGIKVIIAAAGMAAHLAGAMAAQTTLPVIGVPLDSGTGPAGLDALLSTVQMPPGIPVATVAIGKAGAKNAAILAVQILALSDAALAEKLTQFKLDQEKKVIEKDAALPK
jgi:phosphoribosylaminoimidazole carboxylase PurE protein